MTITWYGEGCFKIQSGEAVILSDPFPANVGLTPPRLKADIILKTINPVPLSGNESVKEAAIISGAGEYNLRGVGVLGLFLPKESTGKFLKTAYILEAEKIRICLLGHISEFPEPAVTEHFEDIDIVILPGGGQPFLEQKSAFKLTKQIEPKIVIPSFFKIPGLTRPAADLKIFLEEFNHKKIDQQEKLTIKKKELEEIKGTRAVVLKT